MDISKFESIGDNCEFGFLKRSLGNEDGGLLRWATSPPRVLIEGLRHRFEGLYAYENLSPYWDNVVLDSRYGFRFHSQMISKDKRWLQSEAERQEIYIGEKQKIDYLVRKFLERLADREVICVYKTNDNISSRDAKDLAEAIRSIGPAGLMIVRSTTKRILTARVLRRRDYLCGYIDHFAPYGKADDISPVWAELVRDVSRMKSGRGVNPFENLYLRLLASLG